MPSPERRDWGALLRSQGLGLVCGFATVLLLAVGSFVLAATRDGASRAIGMDDLRGFFAPPSWTHLWFYLLVPVLGLYGLNTTLATWHSVSRKIRAGVTAPARYAPALLHVSFLLAMLAHGVGGLWGAERGEAVLPEGSWQRLPGGPEARLRSLAVDRLPGGMPREVRAAVELRDGAGRVEEVLVGYNQPISSGLGAELHLLGDMGQAPVAELSLGGERCAAVPGAACTLGGAEVRIASAVEAGRMGQQAMAQVQVVRAGAAAQPLWLIEGREAALADGRPVRLEGVVVRPAILVRSRSAPGNPWAFFSALVILGGVALLWRRFLPRAPAPAPEGDDGAPGGS
ncbi:MAG: hypothetical protein HZB56_19020 [Deltaproteobacteria bacterium]|nr:hypothetical protein [Deltaproteobacteria bacterium]